MTRHLLWIALVSMAAGLAMGCDTAPSAAGAPSAAPSAAAPTAKPKSTATAESNVPPLLNPKAAKEEAPGTFKVKLATTQGDIIIEVTRDWAPRGADRFYNLVKLGFFDEMALYRVVKDFVVQFGIHGDPKVSAAWRKAYLMDEMVKESNKKGYLTYAKSGSDTRTSQIFINLQDNPDLDKQGFSPFGKVVEGMDVIGKLYSDYGEDTMARPDLQKLLQEGGEYYKKKFPKLDYIKKATIVK